MTPMQTIKTEERLRTADCRRQRPSPPTPLPQKGEGSSLPETPQPLLDASPRPSEGEGSGVRADRALGRPADLLRSQGGQSLILALAVMFLLVFIGGLFIGIVGRNIMRSRRSGEVLSVQYLAEAGIRYADHQLTYSDDGADWRPVPDYPELVKNLEGVGPYPQANELPDSSDPDYTLSLIHI